MATRESVVTLQRFNQGFTYQDYLAQINVNKDKFQQYYDGLQISSEAAANLRQLTGRPNGAKKMLVLGEDWCPDVFRGIPTLARIAEAAGMEMRIFPRDQHHDIMNEFLKEGQWMSIPTAVFYTDDHEYICHWIERPVSAEKESQQISEEIKAANPEISEQEFMAARRTRTMERFPAWQVATVEEISELLSRTTGA